MPKIPGRERADFVLGDRDGTTCARGIHARSSPPMLRAMGYAVAINDPYKGVELVRRHGRPAERRHSLQIEIKRTLYMDEHTLVPNAGYATLERDLERLLVAIRAATCARACADRPRSRRDWSDHLTGFGPLPNCRTRGQPRDAAHARSSLPRSTPITAARGGIMTHISRALCAPSRFAHCCSPRVAQAAYPERPITLIVPWAAGGGTDATARIIGTLLEKELGQPVNVVNRTGGSGVVGHQRDRVRRRPTATRSASSPSRSA